MKEPKKHPLKWLAVYPGDYVDLRYNGTAEMKAAVLDEMVDMIVKMEEPKFAENMIALARSHEMYDGFMSRLLEGEATRGARKTVKEMKRAMGQDLFTVAEREMPTLEQAEEFGRSMNAEYAKEWHEWASRNNWVDRHGKRIRDWKSAFIKWEIIRNKNYKPPETAKEEK